ncbi:hypothetical protein MtrunA17_Chr3g0081331 [Medicago truncatula]|uniref:Uncharacterized protein n=1 Tax=Medicago truncatula TaxID=3880 RepID=A0A396IJ06_MEDTR|nr:hypothetical protein MtrunA17_Chr3g0081331 [Medicago truncatula]
MYFDIIHYQLFNASTGLFSQTIIDSLWMINYGETFFFDFVTVDH